MAIDGKKLAIVLGGAVVGRGLYMFVANEPFTFASFFGMGPGPKTFGSSSFTPYAPGASRPGPLAPQQPQNWLDALFSSSGPTAAPAGYAAGASPTTAYAPGATLPGPFAPVTNQPTNQGSDVTIAPGDED